MPPRVMKLDQILLVLATLAFAGGLLHAVVLLRAGRWSESRSHWLPMILGFVMLTVFLGLRSRQYGGCPLTDLSRNEVFVFIGWCIVLLYFLVGSAYRLSLLGVFTAPLVVVLNIVAMMLPEAGGSGHKTGAGDPWKEIHVGLSMIAYAAFAFACIAGVMFLLQERFLKRHRIGGFFYQLPPIHESARAIQRLAWIGWVVLTVAMLAALRMRATSAHMALGWGIWAFYGVVGFIMWRHVLSPRQIAWLAAVGFVVPFVSLWLVTQG